MASIDVTEDTFDAEVIQRSKSVPVVVDFWAEWCAPCRMLSPALEQAAQSREGDVVLAKVDTDANPGLAQAYGIQGIPAVKAFKDGEVVDEFVGAQPPANVERFFDGLAPSEADRLVQAGDEASLRRALELHPQNTEAATALAGLLHRRGDEDEALRLVEGLPGFQPEGLAARIRLEQADDLDVDEALRALDEGDTERGLDLLIGALSSTESGPDGVGSGGHKDDLRRVVVGVLDRLGVEHPLARDARRRLAAALY
jgi:putative thioredoxin